MTPPTLTAVTHATRVSERTSEVVPPGGLESARVAYDLGEHCPSRTTDEESLR